MLYFGDFRTSSSLMEDIALLSIHLLLSLPHFIPSYWHRISLPARLLPAFYVLPSVFLSCKFYLEEIHSDENLWPLNPLILRTCNAVIMCDWRMKNGGGEHKLSRSKNDKKERGREKKSSADGAG